MNENVKHLECLKDIQNASSRKEVEKALAEVGKKPGQLLGQQIREENNNKGIRIFLLCLALAAVAAISTFAFIGGGYISEFAGPIALVCGAFDIAMVIVLFSNAVKGRTRFILVAFEIVTLLYLGYATSGFFGGGNLRTAAEKSLTADYAVLKEHSTAMQATADLLNRTIQNANSVKEVEAQRDGKGVVYEKANFISAMKADTIPLLGFPSTIPKFKDLTSGNKWLQSQRQRVADHISKVDASLESMRDQAKSTEASLKDAMQMGLSQQQLSNLQVMAASMRDIASKEPATTKLNEEVLKPKDLKADGFQGIIGYLIDLLVIILSFLLVVLQPTDKKLDEIKEQETRGVMEEILSKDRVPYDAAMIADISSADQYRAFQTMYSSDELAEYVKTKVGFDEFVKFFKSHPMLARKLGTTTWSLAEIRKELDKNPSFAAIADSAIQVSSSNWKLLKSVTDTPEDLFNMEEESRAKFLNVLKQIESKTRTKFRQDELKAFMSQFLLIEKPSNDFMRTLEDCAVKLNAEKLPYITGEFINTATPIAAKYICERVTNTKQFEKIVSGWHPQIDKHFSTVLNNEIVHEENFDRFMTGILDWGGIDGLKKFIKVYFEKKKEVENAGVGNKTMQLSPDFSSIKVALTDGDNDRFHDLIGEAIKVKTSSVDF